MIRDDQPVRLTDVKACSLADACIRIADSYKRDNTLVDGAAFAYIARALIAVEEQPGGPYMGKDPGEAVRLNLAVGYLFVVLGKTLPNVEMFIENLNPAVITDEERQLLRRYRSAKKGAGRTDRRVSHSFPYSRARTMFGRLDEVPRYQALSFLDRVSMADRTGEIAFIAAYAAQALGLDISRPVLNRMGEANVYSWTAYTMYDHMLDGEMTIGHLPAANIAMRLAFLGYKELFPPGNRFHSVITRYFDEVDSANAWELRHCRFAVRDKKITVAALPDYGRHTILAERSGIHILGPLAAATLGSYPSHKISQLETGLRHYLIARQLSDDVSDWREDLAAGQISAVVSQLLSHQNISPNDYQLTQLTELLQDDFWRHSMEVINTSILGHAKEAARHLIQAGCQPSSRLLNLVNRLTKIAAAMMKERAQFVSFSAGYDNALR